MSIYVLDSNFFIQAHRSHYPLDVAEGFWNKLYELARQGSVVSIDKVKKELYDKNDELEDWCRKHLPEDFFKDTSVSMSSYTQVTAWAVSKNEHYLPNALSEFLDADEADAFLIAYCLEDSANRFIVTQELSQPKRQNKVKIPDACFDMNVSFVNTISMFRHLGEKF